MKKILVVAIVLAYSTALVAQKTKPKIMTGVDAVFLQQLEQASTKLNISAKNLKGMPANKLAYYNLIKSANNATTWGKQEYKTFIRKAAIIVNALGIQADPDDGGEIFSDPDDGGEVFISSKLITIKIPKLCPECLLCPVCFPKLP